MLDVPTPPSALSSPSELAALAIPQSTNAGLDLGVEALALDALRGIVYSRDRRPLTHDQESRSGRAHKWREDEPVPLYEILSCDRDESLLVGPPLALPRGGIALLYGDGGIGKSFLAMQLAICVSARRSFLGSRVDAAKVLVLDFENSDSEIARRVRGIAELLDVPLEYLYKSLTIQPYSHSGKTLFDLETSVASVIESHQPSLVIIDGWQAAFGGDPVSVEHVTNCTRLLKYLAGPDRAILVLHHVSTAELSKRRKKGIAPKPSGNRYVESFARVTYYMSRTNDQTVTLQVVKENLGIPKQSITLRPKTGTGAMAFEPAGLVVDISDVGRACGNDEQLTDEERVLRYVQGAAGREVRASELYKVEAERIGKSRKTAQRRLQPVIAKLVAEGRLSSRPYRRTDYLRWTGK